MALVIDETNSGTIKHFNILQEKTKYKDKLTESSFPVKAPSYLKNKSPGYCMYMTSRLVHCVSPLLSASPLKVPPNTPIIVRMVSKLFRMNPKNPPLRSVIVQQSRLVRLSRRPAAAAHYCCSLVQCVPVATGIRPGRSKD